MNKCDEMFYEEYPNVVWQDDTAITVWRDCWKACTDRMIYQMQSRTNLFTEGMKKEYATNEHTQPAANLREYTREADLQQRQG